MTKTAYAYAPKIMVENFVNISGTRRAFYELKTDANNNRVTITFGRIGSKGKTRVYTFNSREETRAFADKCVDLRYAHGYIVDQRAA